MIAQEERKKAEKNKVSPAEWKIKPEVSAIVWTRP